MTLDDRRRDKRTTEEQPDASAIAHGIGTPSADGTSRAAAERLRAAADERYEAVAKLGEDATALREEIGELTHEPATLAEELTRLRKELEQAKDRVASLGVPSAPEPPPREPTGEAPDAEHAVLLDQDVPDVERDLDDEQAPIDERRGLFRRRKRR